MKGLTEKYIWNHISPDMIKKEDWDLYAADEGEEFIWYAVDHRIYCSYGIFDIYYPSEHNFHPVHDYKTDSIINNNFKEKEIVRYGLINSTVNNYNKERPFVSYFVNNNNQISRYANHLHKNYMNSYMQTDFCFNISCQETIFKPNFIADRMSLRKPFVYEGEDINKIPVCKPFVYKKGYADIALSKKGSTTQMTLQGYVLGYTVEYDIADITVKCEIANDSEEALLHPKFFVSINPKQDLNNVVINLSSTGIEKYEPITVIKLVKNVKQEFLMIESNIKVEAPPENDEEELKITIKSMSPNNNGNCISIIGDCKSKYSFFPKINLYPEKIAISKYPELCYDQLNPICRFIYLINNVTSNTLLQNVIHHKMSNDNKSYEVVSSVSVEDCLLLIRLVVSILKNDISIDLQIQNMKFSKKKVKVSIPFSEWLIETNTSKLDCKLFKEVEPIIFTLEPGKKATITTSD